MEVHTKYIVVYGTPEELKALLFRYSDLVHPTWKVDRVYLRDIRRYSKWVEERGSLGFCNGTELTRSAFNQAFKELTNV